MDENLPPSLNVPPVTPPPLPPPPLAPKPPVIAPITPRPSRAGRGWIILAVILLGLLVISVLYNLRNFTSNLMLGHGSRYSEKVAGPKLEEVIREDSDSPNKIALIEVSGIIAGEVIDQGGFSMVELIKAQLKRAEDDHDVKAVLLKVDSPGGEVLASDEISREIVSFQDRSRKPVVVSMQGLAASGGYYISAPCRWIVANDLTITGSIGVIMSSYNYRGLMDKVGILPQVFKSGKYKDMLSGSRDPDKITPEERAMVQALIDETFSKFKGVVRAGRGQALEKNRAGKDQGRALAENWEDYADGRVLSGTEAFRLGFVDELGNFAEALSRAKVIASVSSAKLVQYQQRLDLSDLLRMFGKSESRGLKIDLGVQVPKLQAGRMYFLPSTYVN